jgi:hypothetical protein
VNRIRSGIAISYLNATLRDSEEEMMNMTMQDDIERNKGVVDAYYKAGIQGRLTSFAQYLHPEFVTTAPNYLPWGGTHKGAAFFRDEVLPNLPDVFDFARFSYDSVITDCGRVALCLAHRTLHYVALLRRPAPRRRSSSQNPT